MSKAILYSMQAMSLLSGSVINTLQTPTSAKPSGNSVPKQAFKQNQRKELTKSRKKRNKQF